MTFDRYTHLSSNRTRILLSLHKAETSDHVSVWRVPVASVRSWFEAVVRLLHDVVPFITGPRGVVILISQLPVKIEQIQDPLRHQVCGAATLQTVKTILLQADLQLKKNSRAFDRVQNQLIESTLARLGKHVVVQRSCSELHVGVSLDYVLSFMIVQNREGSRFNMFKSSEGEESVISSSNSAVSDAASAKCHCACCGCCRTGCGFSCCFTAHDDPSACFENAWKKPGILVDDEAVWTSHASVMANVRGSSRGLMSSTLKTQSLVAPLWYA